MRRSGCSLALVGCLSSVLGCSSSGSGGAPTTDAGPDAPPRIGDSTAQADRQACKFARGALPAQTIGASTPLGAEIPIDNIVVVMMENHSFDSYFGHINEDGNRAGSDTVESASADATNPDTVGGPKPWVHGPHLCALDVDHGWDGTHIEIDDGKMDGFAQQNEVPASMLPAAPDGGTLDPSIGSGARAMWWYDQTDLPYYYALADTFAIADHYFCSVPGPTWPNRRFLYAATSFGSTNTGLPLVAEDESKYPYPGNPATILDELESNKVSWMYYSDGLPTPSILYSNPTTRWPRNPEGTFADFQAAAKAGKLPSVSFVDPDQIVGSSGSQGDEHPPGDVQIGQQFVSQVVQAVMSSPQWAHTAIFITHDEHGGFYDHVAPPKACAPDSIAPILSAGDTTQGGFDMYGVRVVLIAVSPYAKKKYVGHHVYDHTSITRFIEARFNLPALTARDANAEPLTDLFDFKNPPFVTPPTLTTPTVDPTELSYCTATFGM